MMLRQKQIPEELIRSALSRIDGDLYKKTLFDLLKSKNKSLKATSKYERNWKLATFGHSHGFEADLAFEVASQIADDK